VKKLTGIDSDSRIILAEGITKYFTELVKSKRIPLTLNRPKIQSRISEINSKLMSLKWSYKPVEQILHSKDLRDIEISVKDIFDSFPEKWDEILSTRGIEGKNTSAILIFIRDFFYRLRERLTNGFSVDFADAIDILCGEVLSVENLDAKNWKCLVTDGVARYQVATNIAGLKKGDIVPIAKLPSQIIHGVHSQGMFLGSPDSSKYSSDDVGKRPELTDKELGQARGILERFFVSKK
jgi:predicted RNA-binding protein with EMAP domain